MFLRAKMRLADRLASPAFARLVDGMPDRIALCDRDLRPLATSAALRDAAGGTGAAAWLRALSGALGTVADGNAPRSVSLPGQDRAMATVAPVTDEDGSLAGFWVRFDIVPAAGPEPCALRAPFDPSQAYAEFDRDGIIRAASRSFHSLAQRAEGSLVQRSIRQIFADPREAEALLAGLASGRDVSGSYAMASPSGKTVWASLHVLRYGQGDDRGMAGALLAHDITADRQNMANDAAILAALSRSQAVIEFRPDGTILTANANFLQALEYGDVADVAGRHHRMFVFRNDQDTPDYAAFWRRLASGEFFTGRFRRVTRTGREIWIEASYNPVFDGDGRVVKIIKFATDCTAQMTVSRKVSSSIGMVEAVAAGSEQMASSIREISTTMQTSREAVTSISHSIDDSVHLAEEMARSAQSMGRVVGLIKDIAGTVNLLAINATIEAARAGSAGKSFAVVASEVKTLAAQTNDAIGEIEQQIRAMQAVSHEVRRNVEAISASASQVTASVGFVANALAEQTAATGDISRNIALIAVAVSELGELVST